MARRKENKVDLSSFDQAGARVFDNPLVTDDSRSFGASRLQQIRIVLLPAAVAAVIAALAGLRLGGALTVPAGLFVLILAALVEWFTVRRFDVP